MLTTQIKECPLNKMGCMAQHHFDCSYYSYEIERHFRCLASLVGEVGWKLIGTGKRKFAKLVHEKIF